MYYKAIHTKTRQAWYGFPKYLASKIGCETKEITRAAEQGKLLGCYRIYFVDAKGIIPEKNVCNIAHAAGLTAHFVREFDIDWTATVKRKKESGMNLNIPIVSKESCHK